MGQSGPHEHTSHFTFQISANEGFVTHWRPRCGSSSGSSLLSTMASSPPDRRCSKRGGNCGWCAATIELYEDAHSHAMRPLVPQPENTNLHACFPEKAAVRAWKACFSSSSSSAATGESWCQDNLFKQPLRGETQGCTHLHRFSLFRMMGSKMHGSPRQPEKSCASVCRSMRTIPSGSASAILEMNSACVQASTQSLLGGLKKKSVKSARTPS
jgi:hypothetical protein